MSILFLQLYFWDKQNVLLPHTKFFLEFNPIFGAVSCQPVLVWDGRKFVPLFQLTTGMNYETDTFHTNKIQNFSFTVICAKFQF